MRGSWFRVRVRVRVRVGVRVRVRVRVRGLGLGTLGVSWLRVLRCLGVGLGV